MITLALPRTATCAHCHRAIAVRESRSRGQLSSVWESVSGSTLCTAAPGMFHEPVPA